jgi:hypothetical protein
MAFIEQMTDEEATGRAREILQLPADGTSTVSDEWQNVALNYAMQNVASVGTCAEIANAFRR